MKNKTLLLDHWIIFSFLALVMLGLIMVASASMVISDQQYGYPFHYFIHQLVYLLMGLGVVAVVVNIPLQWWDNRSRLLMLFALALLLLVLVPGIGMVVNGSRRWLNFIVITIQVSEVAKLITIIYLASYLQRYREQVEHSLLGFVKPLVVLALVALLLLLEPDFGSMAVLSITIFIVLFLANVRLWPFAVLLGLAGALFAIMIFTSPYRLERLTAFLNPWGHQFGSGYQLTQSLIAFGRGGVFGVGLGNSIQKLFYLPEAHTDFLFAVLSEELGLLGEMAVIGLFAVLVGRMLYLAKRCMHRQLVFPAFMLLGFGSWLGLQAVINMGVNAGILPTKGLTLPFMSYGGSSLLVNCAVIGLVLRCCYELHLTKASAARRTRIS